MDELRAHTRLVVRQGRDYAIVETVDEILKQIDGRGVNPFVPLTSVTGQALFPAERFFVRPSDVVSIQEVSDEAWAWMKRAQELGYARQLADLEQTPGERVAMAQEQLAEVLARELSDDDD